ncbi:MAG: SH3 domain-containing protein [Chloroflexota bacterium]|nr:SH3 domain-containing protein [Chloroflexota bacterium]
MSQTVVSAPTAGRLRSGGIQRAIMIAAMIALVFGGLVSLAEPASAASYRTTASLNLREGPGTSFSVVRVIPDGATVEVTGEAQFGFLPVSYSGSSGYASADYLISGGGESAPSPETGTESGPTGTRYADGRLNLRSGPGTSYGVVQVLPDGAAVSLTGEVSNGFSKLTYNGSTGWSATQYLSTSGGSSDGGTSGNSGSGVAVGDTVTGSASTTASLNMRSGPATSYGVKLTMPRGAQVEVMGSGQGGFLPVRYNGTKGWASADYLSTGGGTTTPEPVPNPGSGETVGYKVTTAAVNMRSGPSTSNTVVTVLPPGTRVDITGGAQGGFLPAKWAGRSGWVSADYLAEPDSTPAPDSGNSSNQEIVDIIYAAADRWGQPRADMLRVARCESNLDPRAVNSSSGASGLFQFMPSTFAGTPNGKRGEDIFNAYSSADAAGWMWANGMRNHWVCQ